MPGNQSFAWHCSVMLARMWGCGGVGGGVGYGMKLGITFAEHWDQQHRMEPERVVAEVFREGHLVNEWKIMLVPCNHGYTPIESKQ